MKQIAKSVNVKMDSRSLVAELKELLKERMETVRERRRVLYLYTAAIESAKIGLADPQFPQRIVNGTANPILARIPAEVPTTMRASR
jgi:hypothetical protein